MEEHKRYYMLEDGTDTADLYIFGDITSYGHWSDNDPDRSAYNIVQEIRNIEAPRINVHINSNGGEVSEGLAIYNTLKSSSKSVTTYCDGFACSAASVVFMAGDRRIMSPASLLMIHNAWTFAEGNSEELRKQADDLEKVNQTAVEAYKSVAKIPENQIKSMMDQSTWISASEALGYGFATEISGDQPEGAQQSAMPMIRDQLLNHCQTFNIDKESVKELILETAEAVWNRSQKQAYNHTRPETWDEFFGGRK